MNLFHKILDEIANCVDPDQADLGLHCLFVYTSFSERVGVENFKTMTTYKGQWQH